MSGASVVIPCFNAARHIAATLKSAVEQSRPPAEVIVVDDGSSDRSAAVAEAFGPPVKVLRQKNQGAAVARNRGVLEAVGEWIAFLDDDDEWNPKRLEAVLSVAETADTSVVCVTNDLYIIGE